MKSNPILSKESLLYFGLLLLLAIVFFWPVVIRPGDLIYPSYSSFSDLTVIHWPYAHLLSTAYPTYGETPLWLNVGLSGIPVAPNPLAMPSYPLNFLFLRLPVESAFNLLFILNVFLSGAGFYLFARLGLDRGGSAAFIAAAIYMFSGKLLAHISAGHVSLTAAAACLPWAFLGVRWAISRRSLTASILTGVPLALQMMTHTQIFVYTAYALTAYAVFELWLSLKERNATRNWRAWLREALILMPIPLVAAGLGAAQLLPQAEFAPYTNRALSFSEAGNFALTLPQALVGVFLPPAGPSPELIIYPGLVTLVLAGLAFSARRERHTLFFAGLAAVGALISLGASGLLLSLLYWLAPGWQWLRAANRAWLFVDFALVVLAAYGLDGLLVVSPEYRRGRRTIIGVAGASICVLVGLGLMVGYGYVTRATVALAIIPALCLALIWLYRWGRLSPVMLAVLVLALGLVDLWSFDRSLLNFKTTDEVFSERADLADFLAGQKGKEPFRIYSPSYSVPQPVAAQRDLEMIDGVQPVHLARYDHFMGTAGGYGDQAFTVALPPFPPDQPINQSMRGAVPNARWLGLLNGRYIVADFPVQADGLMLDRTIGSAYVYSNTLALPRAFAVSAVKAAPDGQAAWDALSRMDPGREAVVEGAGDAVLPATDAPRMDVRVALWSPNKIVTEVDLDKPALLVLSEMAYPGWKAYDNGQPVPILRTDYLLRGVLLGPGHHSVAWVYQPASVQWGLRIAGITALLATLALAFQAFRRMNQKL